jgi:hypothetical protein
LASPVGIRVLGTITGGGVGGLRERLLGLFGWSAAAPLLVAWMAGFNLSPMPPSAVRW